MKKVIAGLCVMFVLMPTVSFAQSVVSEQVRLQLITQLLEQVKILQAKLEILLKEDERAPIRAQREQEREARKEEEKRKQLEKEKAEKEREQLVKERRAKAELDNIDTRIKEIQTRLSAHNDAEARRKFCYYEMPPGGGCIYEQMILSPYEKIELEDELKDLQKKKRLFDYPSDIREEVMQFEEKIERGYCEPLTSNFYDCGGKLEKYPGK